MLLSKTVFIYTEVNYGLTLQLYFIYNKNYYYLICKFVLICINVILINNYY